MAGFCQTSADATVSTKKMILRQDIRAALAGDPDLWRDFEALCDFGGRLSGTEGERKALAFLRKRGAQASGVACRAVPVRYQGWRVRDARLVLADDSTALCQPLVRSVATPAAGLTAEVVDLGRGTPEEFDAHREELAGRIALVRHELMFAAGTIHRRRKVMMAREAGAVGFLIAGPLPGACVAGSSGRDGADGIPAAGISPETAARLARSSAGWPHVTLTIATKEMPAETETLLFDIPGRTDEWVVLSAHVDGHDLAESAIDNATGVAAALAVTRALAAHVAPLRRGLRLAFFSVEEWAPIGSAQYVAGLDQRERDAIALNVNLDSVAGGTSLTAMTSGFAGLEPFLLEVAAGNGQALRCVRSLMMNSDHGNFAVAGIPAFRLVAGYDDPLANTRYVLTPSDTRDKVARAELAAAAGLSAAIIMAVCDAPPAEAQKWRNNRARD
jgi:aminopeptidase YwaD